MGRLEDIAARNQHPWKLRGQLAFGVRSLFLLVILGLLIFTDWALSPEDNRPGINVLPPKPEGVNDVKLWSPPKQAPRAQPERP